MNLNGFLKFILISAFLTLSSCVRLDESMRLFFPSEVKELQFVQTQFPAFWWNFLIIEPKQSAPDIATAEALCGALKSHLDQQLRLVFCGDQVASAEPVLTSWAKDFVYRQKFDPSQGPQYLAKLRSTAVQASFISDKKMFSVLRVDPFQSWQDYLGRSENNLVSNFEKLNGFLLDSETGRLIIPIQFQLSPQLEYISPILAISNSYPNVFLIGSHGSTYRNERQVREDIKIVSAIGLAVLFLFLILLVLKSRVNSLFLLVPVAAALYIASLVTQAIDGSVHGLTLAFGSGIVGLTLDYGLHGAFGSESKQTWKSNAIGLLTTLCGVAILLFSGIPLIRQMMIFSIAGLASGFILYFLLFKYFARYFRIKNVKLFLPLITGMKFLILGFVLFGLYGATQANLAMDLKKLSFVSERESKLMSWFFAKSKNDEAFLLVKPKSEASESSANEFQWSQQHKISYDGISKYLPDENVRNENSKSWNQGCGFIRGQADPNSQKIFSPFIELICAEKTESSLDQKNYLNHLVGENHVLSIFTARNDQDRIKITQEFPHAISLTQSLKKFSVSLEKDLTWMIPVSLFLTLLILALYYRDLKAVLTAILPFMTGLGLYFCVALVLSLEVDLISILGLVMVFGFSIDYGVFSTDAHVFDSNADEVSGVYTALTFAALVNILGFLPMLFAGHPVLAHLGFALFFGTLGTYLGTVYGVRPLYEKKVG